VIKYQTTNVCS